MRFSKCVSQAGKTRQTGRGNWGGKGVGTGGLPAQMPNTKDRLTIVDVALAAGNCNY